LVYVPKKSKKPRALVLVLHGGGGIGGDVATPGVHPISVFRTVADREKFIIVYPEGLPSNDAKRLTGWVDCRGDNTISSDANDVLFLKTLVARVTKIYGLSSSKVFMAGGSNGAQMTQAFAFHHPEMVGGVASGAGSLPLNPKEGACTKGPNKGVPILLVHGTADSQMPYNGGCVADIGGMCNRGRVLSAIETRDRWLQINGLFGIAPTKETIDISKSDGGPANRYFYSGRFPLEWWQLEGAGHAVPSRQVLVSSNRLIGIQNQDIEFAEISWAFFLTVIG
jgi:polyhydroxybutyrate depolymerase